MTRFYCACVDCKYYEMPYTTRPTDEGNCKRGDTQINKDGECQNKMLLPKKQHEINSQCHYCSKAGTCDPLKIFQVIVYDCICEQADKNGNQ